MKKVIIIFVWLILVSGLIFLLVYFNNEHNNTRVTREDINLNSDNTTDFVTKNDILKTLIIAEPSLMGKSITEIDYSKIEKKILENPFVASADVYTTNDGCLKINVKQRKPLVRVINNKGQNYYLDQDGKMMPLSDKYTPRIIIAHGNISNEYSPFFKLINSDRKVQLDTNNLTDLQKLYFLSKYINKSDFWKAMIDQIYFLPNGDIEMYLTLGNQSVIFGGIDNLGEKFDKLMLFYKNEISKLGWCKYKSINLKYKDQIVCSKI